MKPPIWILLLASCLVRTAPARAVCTDYSQQSRNAVAGCVDYADYIHWLGGNPALGRGMYEKDLVVIGAKAYLAAGTTLQIVDVSDPASPGGFSILDLTGGGSGTRQSTGVTVVGSLAYVTEAYAGLFIVNVSAPSSPAIVGIVDTPGVAEDVAIAGNYAYVADYSFGLQVIDISDPAHPFIMGHVDTPGNAFGVALSGNIACVADEFIGLQVIDISNPASPMILGTVPNPGTAEAPGNAQDVEAVGTMVYVADGKSGLVVIDASNPSSPVMVGNVDTPGYVWDLRVQGTWVFAADNTNGFTIIDVSNPTAPVIVGNKHTPRPVRASAVSGTTGFLLYQPYQYCTDPACDGLRTIDLSSFMSAPELGSLTVTPSFGPGDKIAASGSLVCASHGTAFVSVFDVSDPTSPVHLSSFPVGPSPSEWGIVRDLAMSGSMVYVTYLFSSYGGLLIVDLSTPARPQIMGHLDLPKTDDVEVSGTTTFVSASGAFPNGFTSQNGFWIVDASDPQNPTLVGGMNPPYALPAGPKTVKDQLAFISVLRGFEVVDISNLTSPTVIGEINLSDLGQTGPMTVSGIYGFVPTRTPSGGIYRAGVLVLQITPFPEGVRRLGIAYAPIGEWWAGQVAVLGLTAYEPVDLGGIDELCVFDASDPVAPRFVGNGNLYTEAIAVAGHSVCTIGASKFTVLPAQCTSSTAVPDFPIALHPALGAAFPNPTLSGSTTIPFTLAQPGHVKIRIMDLQGRAVRTILDQTVGIGETRAEWDGRDVRGERVPAGIYVYELSAPGIQASRKMVRLR